MGNWDKKARTEVNRIHLIPSGGVRLSSPTEKPGLLPDSLPLISMKRLPGYPDIKTPEQSEKEDQNGDDFQSPDPHYKYKKPFYLKGGGGGKISC